MKTTIKSRSKDISDELYRSRRIWLSKAESLALEGMMYKKAMRMLLEQADNIGNSEWWKANHPCAPKDDAREFARKLLELHAP